MLLRIGDICIPGAEFISLYEESCPKALTVKNIESGFRKTRLAPFNPAAALRRLPIIQLTPPDPVVSQHVRTPKNTHDFDQAHDMLAVGGETPIQVARKVWKAAATFQAENMVLQHQVEEFEDYNAQKQSTTSRKRKRIVVDEPITIGNAQKLIGGAERKRTTTWVSKQKCLKEPVNKAEKDQESLEGSLNDDINSCRPSVQAHPILVRAHPPPKKGIVA
jgi:hypothetical protein